MKKVILMVLLIACLPGCSYKILTGEAGASYCMSYSPVTVTDKKEGFDTRHYKYDFTNPKQ